METGLAFSLNSQSGAVIHSGWYPDLQNLFLANPASPLAGLTRLANDSTGSVALTAGSAYREEALLIPYLAGAVTSGAAGWILTFRGPTSFAGGAGILTRNLDFGLQAEGSLAKGNLQIVPEVRASLRTAAAAASENIAKPEKFAENIAEIAKRGGVETAESSLQSAVPVSIVTRALVGVAQNAVGLGRLLEFFFGGLVIRIFVGMIFQSKLSISALYLLVRCVVRNSQYFVAIPFVVQYTIPTIS